MGILYPDCMTTDAEATTFYAYATASTYSDNNYQGISHRLIIKSNANPPSPREITWSLVSMIPTTNLTQYQTYDCDYSCAVSPQGVFNLFGRITDKTGKEASSPGFGIQYDPKGSMDPSFNFKGPGGWSNITIDSTYDWKATFGKQVLGYVSDGMSSTLVHLMESTNNTIIFATLNEATKTFTPASTWAMNITTHGSMRAMAIGNNQLYTFGIGNYSYPQQTNGPSLLTAFPLGTISPTTPVGKSFNASQVYKGGECYSVYLYCNRNTLTLICGRQISNCYPTPSSFFTIRDPNNADSTGPPTNFTNEITGVHYFVPLGDGTSPTSFALMFQRYRDMKVFGNDNGFRYTHLFTKVNISDPLGINPNPSSVITNVATDAGSVAGIIIGLMAAGLLLIGSAVWCFRARKARKARNANSTPSTTTNKPHLAYPQAESNYIYPQEQSGQSFDINYYSTPAGQYPTTTTYHPGQAAPTATLPMAPITPVPQQKHQTYQDQMQALQFSSHPRPNVVTTAYSTEPETSNPPIPYPGWSGAPQAAWQPTPFIPPAQPASSTGLSSPAADHSPSPSATAFSSTPGQSFQDPQAIVHRNGSETPTNSSSKPLPSLPSIPHDTRPSPDIGSPHT